MHDATQIRLLEAMGYRLLRRAVESAPLPDPAEDRSAAGSIAESADRPAASPPPSTPAAAPQPARIAPTPIGNAPGDRLWAALLGAAAIDPARTDALGIRRADSGVGFEYIRDELWIDPLVLRGDAGAKRRLWKGLRALRRRELGR